MSTQQTNETKKCLVVHLPIHLVKEIEELKEKSNSSKNELLVRLIEKGLELSKKQEG